MHVELKIFLLSFSFSTCILTSMTIIFFSKSQQLATGLTTKCEVDFGSSRLLYVSNMLCLLSRLKIIIKATMSFLSKTESYVFRAVITERLFAY